MTVKRKSNWYIYVIAFGITLLFVLAAIFAFRWFLFPDKTVATGLDTQGELSDNFKPSDEYNFNMLTMLSDGEQDIPELFVMASYDSVENRFTFIPLPNGISVSTQGRTLPNVYAAQGGSGVISALNGILGIQCDSYVKLNRSEFVNLISSYGNVEYDVAKTIIIKDGVEVETINSGKVFFTAEMMFRYIMLADFGEGELYRFNCIGGVLSELVNQNFRNVDSSLFDAYFYMLRNSSDNNLTEAKYLKKKAALLNTTEYGNSPAEYYIPYGEYTEDGGFAIADNSIISIKQKAGLL